MKNVATWRVTGVILCSFLVVFVIYFVVHVLVGLWESRAERGTTRTEEW